MNKLVPVPVKGPKPPRPVESFGPEILAALLRGATEPLILTMPYKMGVRFRLRIHQLRESMRLSGHEKYNLCARVRVTIQWPLGTPTEKSGRHVVPLDRGVDCKVTLCPNDTEFTDLLSKAGVSTVLGQEDTALLDRPHPDLSALEEMLKDL